MGHLSGRASVEQLKRRAPGPMPTAAQVDKANAGLVRPFRVAGSRSAVGRRTHCSAQHARYRGLTDLQRDQLAGKHIVLFVHGYNVTSARGLRMARALMSLLQEVLPGLGQPVEALEYLLFTWPGDPGEWFFGAAQEFAEAAGVALFELIRDLARRADGLRISLVTHSLGAHVGLRAGSLLGERRAGGQGGPFFETAQLLAPAVVSDAFEPPAPRAPVHFPGAAFAIGDLHVYYSRNDPVLRTWFPRSQGQPALGYSGLRSLAPLRSLARRVEAATGERFTVDQHDFSKDSPTLDRPEVMAAAHHGDYWANASQVRYYARRLLRGPGR